MEFIQNIISVAIVLCFIAILFLPALVVCIIAKDAKEELQKAVTETTTSTSSKQGNLTIITGYANSLTREEHASIQKILKNILGSFVTKAPRVLYIKLSEDWSSYFIYRQQWFGFPDQVFAIHFWPEEIHATVYKEKTNFIERVYLELETLGEILDREMEVTVR